METTKTIVKNNVVKIKSEFGYTEPNKTLAKLTDTGNGYIIKFPAWTSIHQDYYVCLDYAQAEYLFDALKEVLKKES